MIMGCERERKDDHMTCSRCEKKIGDKALLCPYCGQETINYQSNGDEHAADGLKLKNFNEAVKTPFVLSIISIVWCLGFGFIFAIICKVMCKRIYIPELDLSNPADIAVFQRARKKLTAAERLSSITFGIIIVIFALAILFAIAIP